MKPQVLFTDFFFPFLKHIKTNTYILSTFIHKAKRSWEAGPTTLRNGGLVTPHVVHSHVCGGESRWQATVTQPLQAKPVWAAAVHLGLGARGVCLLEVQPWPPLSLPLPIPSLRGRPGPAVLTLVWWHGQELLALPCVCVWMNRQKDPEGPTPHGPYC